MKRWIILSAMFALSLALVAPLPADDAKKDDKKPEMKKDEVKKDDEKKGDEKPKKEPEAKLADFSAYATAEDGGGEVFKVDDSSVTIRLTRKGNKSNGYKDQHIDTVYKYAEGGLARRKEAPPFFDDKGLKRAATSNELEKLRKPAGAPGYAIERTDLKVGDIVQLKLLRPKTISAAKAKPEDLVIKFAIMVGEKGGTAKDDPKKK